MQKHRSRRTSGETLVETLVTILVVTLSCLLFMQFTMASTKINREAQDADAAFETVLSTAEQQQSASSSGEVAIGTRSYDVDYFIGTGSETIKIVSYSAKDDN